MGVVTLTGPKLLCQMLAVVDVGMSERRESQRNFVKEGERENESVRERVENNFVQQLRVQQLATPASKLAFVQGSNWLAMV